MSNNGYYETCPYFVSEKNKTITCEDTLRRYGTTASKVSQLRKYCCDDWINCKHAKQLSDTYRTVFDKDFTGDKEKTLLTLTVNSQRKEINKLISMLGAQEKKNEKLISRLEDAIESKEN